MLRKHGQRSEHLLAWSSGSFGDLYFPSKIQWDPIPTDPVQYVAMELFLYLGLGVPSVGPVGDFLHILDLLGGEILTFILYTMVHHHETTIWENIFCFFQASKKQIQVSLLLNSFTLPETDSNFSQKRYPPKLQQTGGVKNPSWMTFM